MKKIIDRTTAILGSRRFFWVVLAFFVFEAAWIALSAVYPMAFDEDFHFGLIKVYSHYWLPFLTQQPPHANAFGAVPRDPSYLYHYIMSFPYRLISLVIHGQTGQVIIMRLLDVALFSSGLILFRKVLLRAKLSPQLTNLSILIFSLIPIAPQLAAHVNYDDLVFPLVALLCLLTFRLTDELRQKQPTIKSILLFLAVGFFGTQVKYAYLPVFAAAIVFLLFMAFRQFRGQFSALLRRIAQSWKLLTRWAKVGLLIAFLVPFGLFVQRDGVNLVKYHGFTPDCGQVLNTKDCMAYGPWAYSYKSHEKVLHKEAEGKLHPANPIAWLGEWIYWMWYRLFFAINTKSTGYVNYPPLPILSASAAVIAIGGVVALAVWCRRVFRNNPYLVFFVLACLFYVMALWADGYAQYRYTHELVTMNGRYLLPILLLFAALIGRALSLTLRKSPARKTILALAAVVLFLQGGGFLTFIDRSDASWDWPNSAVVKVNNAARDVTSPLIIDGSKYYSSRYWFFN